MKLVMDIESAFDEVVITLGGSRVDQIATLEPNIQNCDYIFQNEGLIAELKRIEEDRSEDPAYWKRLASLWIKWRQEGLVHGEVPPIIDSRKIPRRCAEQMIDLQGRGIKKRIAKANNQLKSTAEAMGLKKYYGLLIITNEGNLIFNPPAFIHFLFRTISKDFSSIHSFVYFTTNLAAKVPGTRLPTFFWFHGTLTNQPTGCESLIDAMHEKWTERVNTESGATVVDLKNIDMASFWQAHH